jgi:hypothetical protein
VEILIRYGSDERLSPEVLNEVRVISGNWGTVSEETWGMRAGAIDLVTILEIVVVFAAMKLVDGFVEGLVGKDWFARLGRKTRSTFSVKLREFSDYLTELFHKVIRAHRDRYGAIAVIENVDGATIFAVLNHKHMNAELIASLPLAIAIVVRHILINGLPKDSQRVVQLFPNFETDSWDYLFVPSTSAFGQFIDRYLNLRDEEYHLIRSAEEFRERFDPHNADIFKLLITPNRNYDRSVLDDL